MTKISQFYGAGKGQSDIVAPMGIGNGIEIYVDGNGGLDSNDGRSWDQAYKTLAKAFAVSHANIAVSPNWARRNTIYICGDTFVEDIVAFPQKTDVIGCGADDAYVMAGITGDHAPVNTNFGCRFFNIRFLAKSAGPIVTLTSVTSGLEFIGCLFDANGTAHVATRGILNTASPFMKLKGCRFQGAFATDFVYFAAGDVLGTEIISNIMTDGADNGVVCHGSTTASYKMVIKDNLIECADIALSVPDSVAVVVNNTLISGEAVGSGSYVIDLTFASNNLLTGNDVSVVIPDISTN